MEWAARERPASLRRLAIFERYNQASGHEESLEAHAARLQLPPGLQLELGDGLLDEMRLF